MNEAEPRSLFDYLGDILDAIERIQRYTEGLDEHAFVASDLVSDAVLKRIEVIGEAATQLTAHYPHFARANVELPLRVAADTRNALSHGYHKIALERVWQTVQTDLPPLYVAVRQKQAEL